MAASSKMAIRHRSRSIPALVFGPADTADFSTLLKRWLTCREQVHYYIHLGTKYKLYVFNEINNMRSYTRKTVGNYNKAIL